MPTPQAPAVDLGDLVRLFYPEASRLATFEPCHAPALPQPYRDLLAHESHMTVTVEAHHGSLVDVDVLRTKQTDQWYAREITLRRQSDGVVVQYGIVRLRHRLLASEVWGEIVSQTAPLGRVLIRHNVLRQVQLCQLWRAALAPPLAAIFAGRSGTVTYGRTAWIFCDHEPAIELLEIVAAEP